MLLIYVNQYRKPSLTTYDGTTPPKSVHQIRKQENGASEARSVSREGRCARAISAASIMPLEIARSYADASPLHL